MKLARTVPLLFCLLMVSPAMACTIFCFTYQGRTYFCNNEDWKDPATMIRFQPAENGNYAWVYLGFSNNWAQGGVNEKGLCFDWVAGGGPYGWKEDSNKKTFKGNLSEEMMRTCASVEEAIAFYQTYNEEAFNYGRTFIADSSGQSAQIGWNDGKFFVEKGQNSGHSCGFGKSAVDERLKGLEENFSLAELAGALNDASQVGTYPSQYSNIICLSEGKIILYRNRNYDEYLEIDYVEKLKENAEEFLIADLFETKNLPPHVTKLTQTIGQQQYDAEIARVETLLSSGVIFEGDRYPTLSERMEHYQVPGLCLAVVKDHQVIWSKAYGVKDLETREAVTTNTLFQCASISKAVSAAAALNLVEAKKLELDRNVNEYLESWQLPGNRFNQQKDVTLRHLIGHTAGISGRSFRGYPAGATVPSFLKVLAGSKPANSGPVVSEKVPGTEYRYSGGGYCIIQQMLVDTLGQPFSDTLDQQIFKPCGMNHCTFEQPLPLNRQSEAASGHLPNGLAVSGARHTYPEMAAAGLYATAPELAKFFIEIQLAYQGKSNRVISQRTAKTMLTTTASPDYGMGVVVKQRGEEVYFGHDGWTEGFCSEAIMHRDRGYGVIVLTNGNHPWLIREIFNSVARTYDWDNYALPEYKQLTHKEELLANVVGRYKNGSQVITLTSREGQLFMTIGDKSPTELFRVGENQFACRTIDSLICYSKNRESNLEQITFQKPWDLEPHPSNIATKMTGDK